MPPSPFSKLINPRFPPAALGLESNNATVVHLDRGRGGYTLRRAATITLPENLLHPSFDEQNIADSNTLVGLLSEVALSAGLGKQRKWSVALPEAATRASILTLESAPASRAELEEVLHWKYERAFGAPEAELRVSRERLSQDSQGKQRYLAVGIRLAVLDEYEAVFEAMGWRAGLILPRHQGEARWVTKAGGDALLVSSHAEGFTALVLRDSQPAIARSVICEAQDRDDELYRLLLFYRDRLAQTDGAEGARALDRLLVVGEGFNKTHVGDLVQETLEARPRILDSADVGLALPSNDLSFDALAAPAGLATLAW